MIDKLSLTTYRPPSNMFLELNGDVYEQEHRKNLYKYSCRLDKAYVLWKPHKFGQEMNDRISYCKIDLNPKHFICYGEMWAYMDRIFRDGKGEVEIEPGFFHVSRVDIAVDLEDFNIKHVLSSLHVKNIRDESLNIYKGTIYAGTDPKIRIYNKTNEIKARLRKGFDITEEEKRILETGKDYTRFEIQIRKTGLNLKTLSETAAGLASYFDRLEFISD